MAGGRIIQMTKRVKKMIPNSIRLRFLNAKPKLRVEIGGHTGNVGSASYNLQLSEKRAQSVANYLVQQGIDVTRIIQKGYGAQQPVRPNDTEDNRQANRRIEFKILN